MADAALSPLVVIPCRFKSDRAHQFHKMILAAAILKDGVIYTGKRHGHIIRDTPEHFDVGTKPNVQGFVDHEGNFLNREEGALHAKLCGQVEKLKFHSTELCSEDLW